jgi:hypothetical protein
LRQLLAAATAAAALTGCVISNSPVEPISTPTEYEMAKSYHLGKGRANLMTICDHGRQLNSLGTSYWDSAMRERRDKRALARGFSASHIEAGNAGEAAAMAEVCPDVR